MKAGIETIEQVYENYGPTVAQAASYLWPPDGDGATIPLGDIVDAIVYAIEATLVVVLEDTGLTFERKPGF